MNSDDNPSTAPPTEPQPPNASEAARPPDDWVVTTPVEGEVITSLATGNSLRDEFCNGRQRFLRTLRLEMFSDSALARLCGWFRLLAHLWILPEIILTASCPPSGAASHSSTAPIGVVLRAMSRRWRRPPRCLPATHPESILARWPDYHGSPCCGNQTAVRSKIQHKVKSV